MKINPNALLRNLMDRFYRPILSRYLERERRLYMAKFHLTVPPTVFHPAFFGSTRVFLSFLKQEELNSKKVLEIGCGSGVLSLFAASKGAIVTAVDINPEAVRATQQNARNNDLSIQVLPSDLFSSVTEQTFDTILVNPPFFDKDPEDLTGHAWYCGTGFSFFARFFARFPVHLRPNGQVWMILSETCNQDAIRELAQKEGIQMVLAYTRTRIFEKFWIYRLSL